MAIRVQTAGGLTQVGSADRFPLNPAAGVVGIAAGVGNDLMAMQKRAEIADRERKKFEIANAANEAIEQTQTALLEIQDPEEYRKTADKSYARIVDTVNQQSPDDDMRMEVTQIIGARLRAARVAAAGEAIRKSGEQAWESFQFSLDSGRQLQTQALASDYYAGLKEQSATLAKATLQPEAEVERRIQASEGENSDFRYYRDLALYKEGNFSAWEKVVKNADAFDERYPHANSSLRAQALNQVKTYNGEMFDRMFTSAAVTFDNLEMRNKLNPVARLPMGPAEQVVSAAASVARTPSDRAKVDLLKRKLQQFEAHNSARDSFVVKGGAAPMQDEVFQRSLNVTGLSNEEVVELTAKADYLSAVGTSFKQNGSKRTAAQFVGSTMLSGEVPAWDDPQINAYTQNAREVMGTAVSPMDKGEFAQYQNVLKRGSPIDALEAIQVTRRYDAQAKRALLGEMAADPIEGFEDRVVFGLTAFSTSDVATMQAINGARSEGFPELANSQAVGALAEEMKAFYLGSNFDAEEFTSALTVAKAIGIGRGMPPDEVGQKLPKLLSVAVGYDEKTGTGGFTTINGVTVLVPPVAEAGEFEHKLRAAPLSVLEQFSNGPILQGEDLKRMETGGDLLDAGMHPVSIGGGVYRMMKDDRELRVAPGGRPWEVDLNSFTQSYTVPVRPRTQPTRDEPLLPNVAPLPIGSSFRGG